MSIALLIIALFIILFGAEAFTNALEHLGQRLKISEGVTGSIFAAVGTALPEAMVPVVAVLGVSADKIHLGEEVGVGAILGAPMMLSTLTLVLMAGFAAQRRGWGGEFKPERTGLERDLTWFLMAFGLSAIAIFVPHDSMLVRSLIAITLVLMYFIYILLTVRASAKLVQNGHGTEADHPLYLSYVRLPENMFTIVLQLAIGLGLIVLGAKGFVHGIEDLSALIGVSALVLSLLIIPVATELPEKINSILWIRRHRDTGLRQYHRRHGVSGQHAAGPRHHAHAVGAAPRGDARTGTDAGGQWLSFFHAAPRHAAAVPPVIQRPVLRRFFCLADVVTAVVPRCIQQALSAGCVVRSRTRIALSQHDAQPSFAQR